MASLIAGLERLEQVRVVRKLEVRDTGRDGHGGRLRPPALGGAVTHTTGSCRHAGCKRPWGALLARAAHTEDRKRTRLVAGEEGRFLRQPGVVVGLLHDRHEAAHPVVAETAEL